MSAERPADTVAFALDLGSTRIKAGRIDGSGRLHGIRAAAAPALRGQGSIREGDPLAYVDTARQVLRDVTGDRTSDLPLGIASQRSSFVIWEAPDGPPVTPMISWQDRRAARWCSDHEESSEEVYRISGLPLSAHYLGPKLAAMQELDRALRSRLHSGRFRVGTLDSFLLSRIAVKPVHRTEFSLAARTQVVDLERGDWSPRLLDLYDIPRNCLPSIEPSAGGAVELLHGLRLQSVLADQAAGVAAALPPGNSSVLLSIGTGAFVLRRIDDTSLRKPGYLTGPLGGDDGRSEFAIEGAINGAGPALSRFGAESSRLPESDDFVDAFAIPDLAGLGAPHWRPQIGLTLSSATRVLQQVDQRRVVLEGLLFRLKQILDDLGDPAAIDRVLLTGGVTREPDLAPGLAALLQREVEVLNEAEGVLLGIGRKAAGFQPYGDPPTTVVRPGTRGTYLPRKYGKWSAWLQQILD